MGKKNTITLNAEIRSDDCVIYSNREYGVTIALPWWFTKGQSVKVELDGGAEIVKVREM